MYLQRKLLYCRVGVLAELFFPRELNDNSYPMNFKSKILSNEFQINAMWISTYNFTLKYESVCPLFAAMLNKEYVKSCIITIFLDHLPLKESYFTEVNP